MSTVAFPTPCPPPRPGNHLPITALQSESTITGIGRNLLNVRPRRAKAARDSLGWDPTVDIYDDTFALQKPSEVKEDHHQAVDHEAQKAAGLLSGQPRRTTMGPAGFHDANTKRRRTFVVNDPLPEEKCSATAKEEMKAIKKSARRRTIYVPSEDTTIITIHPGASWTDEKTDVRRPPRSDVFLDLAALPEAREEDNQRTSIIFHAKALAGPPRRAPLLQTTRQVQPRAFQQDVLGSGGGKENIPPGMHTTCHPKGKPRAAAPNRASIAHNISSSRRTPSPSVSSSKLCPNTMTLKILQPMKISLMDPVKSFRTAQPKPVVPTGTQGTPKRSFVAPLKSSPRVRARAPVACTPLRLNVPVLAQRDAQQHHTFPVISESISRPELYEDNWLCHQEVAITQLINSLYEGAGHGSHDVGLQVDELRKKLIVIYDDSKVAQLHQRLQASLRFGALSISKDTLAKVGRLKDDLGQRQKFLDLFLKTYDTTILQAVAETVTGRTIPQNKAKPPTDSPNSKSDSSSSSSKRLAAFFRMFLVRNEDGIGTTRLTNKGSQFRLDEASDGFDEVGSTAWTWRRTAIRSLMLVLLIDKAAIGGLFKRCVFQACSPYKSSLAVLQALSSLLLPSIGDVPRVLGHLNYQLSHAQYPLQELNYHIENIAVDLRDGVLLARLVEILLHSPSTLALQRANDITVALSNGEMLCSATQQQHQGESWALSQHLKYPCISRVQKLYNVQIALSALHGVKTVSTMVEGVEAKDIVDGHREQTLGLLWTIVSRWGLNILLDFSLVRREIKRLRKTKWQARSPDGELEKEEEEKEEEEDAEVQYLDGLELQTRLLLSWSRLISRKHGISITNLTTSFADGRAYKAIVDEYTALFIPDSTAVEMPPTFSTTVLLQSTNTHTTHPTSTLHTNLLILGCSRAFVDLFRSAITVATLPSIQTPISLLAFLASRFLPAAQPLIAAGTIQRAWRASAARREGRKLFVLAVLARDCKVVVSTREEIVGAAVRVQRWWRRVRWVRWCGVR